MATIAAQVGSQHEVKVADASVWRKQTGPRLLAVLEQFRPDLVGFTSMTFQYETAVTLAYLTKQFSSNIYTALGGYHATLLYEELGSGPDRGYWDFLFRGEGDLSFGELLDCLANEGRGMDGIGGLSYRKDGVFVHNPARPLEDLSRIKIPARDKRIAKGFHMYFRPADAIETSRGCLHSCNFCSIHEMYGQSFRLFPLERVLADIEDAYSRGARHILVTDDNITLDMERFEELCDGVIRLKLRDLMFTTQASPSGFAKRPAIAKKMAQAGFVHVFLGIENASIKSLQEMHKPNTLDTTLRGVRALQKERIIVIAGIINGLRHDDEESIRQNYQFIKDLGITAVMDQILTPYPKTPVRAEMLEQGRIRNPSDFRWYDGYFSNVRTDFMTAEELNFSRWRIRREVIGMWRPSPGDWHHFKAYTWLWEFVFRPLVWLNERLLQLLLGIEGRYKLQMRQFLRLNELGTAIPGRTRAAPYHPVFGSDQDPFGESRRSMLGRRLPVSAFRKGT